MADEKNGGRLSDASDYSSEDEGTEDYRRGGYHAVRVGILSRMDLILLKATADDTKCVVKLLDHFKHAGPNGQHVCMVFEYLGDNLLSVIKYSDYRGVPLSMVKELCFHILVGLDYLHRKLSIIHTDIKPENIVLCSTINPEADARRSGTPLVLPNDKDKTVTVDKEETKSYTYGADMTKNQKKKKIRKKAKKVVVEGCGGEEGSEENERASNGNSTAESSERAKDSQKSGNNRRGSRSTRRNSQVIFRQGSTDLPRLFSAQSTQPRRICGRLPASAGDVLFDPHSGENFERDEDHLALMMELLGMMPRKIALGGRYSRDYFNRQGRCDAVALQDFITPILEFAPEKRPTAAQCLTHPWMNPVPRSLKASSSPRRLKEEEEEEARDENKSKEKDEREAMEVGVGNIAIDGSELKTSGREGRQSARSDLRT
uniref:non-specific serine/threonine protein kinase n=1 Tax=Brassica oleracea var. oleracea TaxID=109376 RepID=A0A0D3AKL9_BRAOL